MIIVQNLFKLSPSGIRAFHHLLEQGLLMSSGERWSSSSSSMVLPLLLIEAGIGHMVIGLAWWHYLRVVAAQGASICQLVA